jgi:hypothetical protein
MDIQILQHSSLTHIHIVQQDQPINTFRLLDTDNRAVVRLLYSARTYNLDSRQSSRGQNVIVH